jgi:hypothetical protein
MISDITIDYKVDKLNLEFEINEEIKSSTVYPDNKIKY